MWGSLGSELRGIGTVRNSERGECEVGGESPGIGAFLGLELNGREMAGSPPGPGLCRTRRIPRTGLSGIRVGVVSSGVGAVWDQTGIPWHWGHSGHRDRVDWGSDPRALGLGGIPRGRGQVGSRAGIPRVPLRRDPEPQCRRGCAGRCGWCGSERPRAGGPGSGWRRRPGVTWWI